MNPEADWAMDSFHLDWCLSVPLLITDQGLTKQWQGRVCVSRSTRCSKWLPRFVPFYAQYSIFAIILVVLCTLYFVSGGGNRSLALSQCARYITLPCPPPTTAFFCLWAILAILVGAGVDRTIFGAEKLPY